MCAEVLLLCNLFLAGIPSFMDGWIGYMHLWCGGLDGDA